MVETAGDGVPNTIPLKIASATYPLTLTWESTRQPMNASLIIGTKEIRLQSRGSVSVKNPEQLALRLSNESALPKEYALEQNYPNPFNPLTVIRYQLPVESKVTLKIFNVLGQVVATLVDGIQDAGYKSAEWNANRTASGVYFYSMEAIAAGSRHGSYIQVKKMLYMK